MTPEEVAEQAYSAGNLVTCDGYYEFDLDAAAAVIRTAMNEAATALQSLAAQLAEAREEAARIVDQMTITQRAIGRPDDWPEDAWNARQVGIIDKLERAAEKIRALKGSQQ